MGSGRAEHSARRKHAAPVRLRQAKPDITCSSFSCVTSERADMTDREPERAPNLFEPVWDVVRDDGGWKRARVGQQAGGCELGASLFELGPGHHTFPLHAHFVNEEMVIILSG